MLQPIDGTHFDTLLYADDILLFGTNTHRGSAAKYLGALLTDNIDNTKEIATFEKIDTLALELAAFARTILGKADYPVKISEALAGVSTMEAIAKSAKTGLKVEVPSYF